MGGSGRTIGQAAEAAPPPVSRRTAARGLKEFRANSHGTPSEGTSRELPESSQSQRTPYIWRKASRPSRPSRPAYLAARRPGTRLRLCETRGGTPTHSHPFLNGRRGQPSVGLKKK